MDASAFVPSRLSRHALPMNSGLLEPEHAHREVRIVMPRAQVPGGESVLKGEVGPREVGIEISDGIAISVESGNREASGHEVRGDPREHELFGARSDECQHIAGDDDSIEWLGLAERSEIKGSKIRLEPDGPDVVGARALDEYWIDVYANDVMTAGIQGGTHPAGTAAGIKNARAWRHHGIDEASLAGQIRALCGETTHPPQIPV